MSGRLRVSQRRWDSGGRSGDSGGAWLADEGSWSRGVFPRYAAKAAIESKTVVLTKRTRGAASSVGLFDDAKLVIDKHGLLELGPRDCDADEVQTMPSTATSDTECEREVPCTSAQWQGFSYGPTSACSTRFLIVAFSYLYFLIYASKENRRYQFS